MEELFTLIVVIVSFVIWVAQNVTQMKKRSQEEFDEAWQQMEDEESLPEETRSRIPSPAAPPAAHPPRPSAPTLKDLQEQLEQMLGQPPKKPAAPAKESSRPAPVTLPETQRRLPDSVPSPTFLGQESTRKPHPFEREPVPAQRRPPQTVPTAQRPAPVAQRAQQPAIAAASSDSVHAEPVPRYHRTGKFPQIHPHPVSNAILIAEILKPYSRRGAFGPWH